MTDAVDFAAAIEAEHVAAGLRRIDAAIPQGVSGECDECGEQMPRLVGGRCGFCRDGRRPPDSFYSDRDEARSAPPSPAKEHATMTVKQPALTSRKIAFTGAALDAIERRADMADIPLSQAAAELIDIAVQQLDELAFPNDGPQVLSTPAGVLSICDVDELLDELRDRFNAAAAKRDLKDDLEATTVRANAAEARLAAIRAQAFGE